MNERVTSKLDDKTYGVKSEIQKLFQNLKSFIENVTICDNLLNEILEIIFP